MPKTSRKSWPLLFLATTLLGLGACQVVIFLELESRSGSSPSPLFSPFAPSTPSASAQAPLLSTNSDLKTLLGAELSFELELAECTQTSPPQPPWRDAAPRATLPFAETRHAHGSTKDPKAEEWLSECLNSAFARH